MSSASPRQSWQSRSRSPRASPNMIQLFNRPSSYYKGVNAELQVNHNFRASPASSPRTTANKRVTRLYHTVSTKVPAIRSGDILKTAGAIFTHTLPVWWYGDAAQASLVMTIPTKELDKALASDFACYGPIGSNGRVGPRTASQCHVTFVVPPSHLESPTLLNETQLWQRFNFNSQRAHRE